ncbi:hypothetical protein SBOR_9557 [Sclerotinia borealis F-4128]|uniref:Uncharacterized protein n=1 Tax=Sclerotinia borealis (strain F-4128) TaxID=1432307 RepID=W9C577_SCLBF|nr:hypothetical protein SBOR_9557 [Sclerotinia borealis F-4128]
MRRRMAESDIETAGSRKRKRKEKKRKWRWTLGDGEDSGAQTTPTTAMERTPITSIWRGAETTNTDSIMTGNRNENGNGNGSSENAISGSENEVPSDEAINIDRYPSFGNVGEAKEATDDRDRRGHSVDLYIL